MSTDIVPIQPGGARVEVEFVFDKFSMNAAKPFNFTVQLATNCGKQGSELYEYLPETKSAVMKKGLKSTIIVFPDRVNFMDLLFVTDGISKSQTGNPKLIGRVVLDCLSLMNQKQIKFVKFLTGGPDPKATISFSFTYQVKEPAQLFTLDDIKASPDIDIKLANKFNKLGLNLNLNETMISVASVNESTFFQQNGDFGKKEDHYEEVVQPQPVKQETFKPTMTASIAVEELENHALEYSLVSMDLSQISANDSTFFQKDKPKTKLLQSNPQKIAVQESLGFESSKHIQLEIDNLRLALANEKEKSQLISTELEKVNSDLSSERAKTVELKQNVALLQSELDAKENMCAIIRQDLKRKEESIAKLQAETVKNNESAAQIKWLDTQLATEKALAEETLMRKDQIIADLNSQVFQLKDKINAYSMQIDMLEHGQRNITSQFEILCQAQNLKLKETLNLIDQDLNSQENGHENDKRKIKHVKSLPDRLGDVPLTNNPTDYYQNGSNSPMKHEQYNQMMAMNPHMAELLFLVTELEQKTGKCLVNNTIVKSLADQQRKQIDELTVKVQESAKQIADLQLELNVKEQECSIYQKTVGEINAALIQRDNLISNYECQLKASESHARNSDNRTLEVTAQIAVLNEQIVEWSAKYKTVETENKKLAQDQLTALNECTLLRKSLAEMQTEMAARDCQISDLQYSIDMLHQKMKEQADTHLETAKTHSSSFIEKEKVE